MQTNRSTRMGKRASAVAAAVLVATLALPLQVSAATAATAAAAAAPGGPGAPGMPGVNNAITDVRGLQVGQIQAIGGDGYLTGTTVVYAPDMAVAGVSQRGGAPATKELDLLSPLNSNMGVNAVALNGSSAFGLDSTTGMMKWLEEKGQGVNVGAGVVPIVPGMSIFDLNRGGNFKARVTDDWGYRVLNEASNGDVSQGTVGGGTGANAGGLKGGVGTASVTLADGTVVGAIVIINSVGKTLNPQDCSQLGAPWEIADEFGGLKAPTNAECFPVAAPAVADSPSMNTTIALVATDANLEKAAAAKLADVGNDGLARAINPLHTLSDGDTVIGMSTGKDGQPLRNNNPADTGKLNQIYNAGANVLTRAVVHAMINADTVGTRKSYCDTYPSACADLQITDPGTAVDIDPNDPLGLGTEPTGPGTTEPSGPGTTDPTDPATSDPATTTDGAPTDGTPTDGAPTDGAQPVPGDGGGADGGDQGGAAAPPVAGSDNSSGGGGLAFTGVQMLGTMIALGAILIGVGALTLWRPRISAWLATRRLAGTHH